MSDAPRAGRPHMPGYGVPETADGVLPWAEVEERLAANRNYYVATVSADGTPHAMPVWGVWVGGRLYFSTGAGSRKARNLAERPACVITTEEASRPVIVEGVAAVATDRAALKRAGAAYEAKYEWKLDPSLGPIFEVRPRKAFAFIEAAAQFSQTATRYVWA